MSYKFKKTSLFGRDKNGELKDFSVLSQSEEFEALENKVEDIEDIILPLLHFVTGDYPELPTYPKENVIESLMETVMQLIGTPPEENTQLPPSATMEGKKITYGVIAPINRACCLVRLCAYIPQLKRYAAIEPTSHLIDYMFAYSFDVEVVDQVMPLIVDTDGTIRLRIMYMDIISGLYTDGQEFTVNVNG